MSAAGKWNVSMDTPIGRQNFVWDLQQSGGAWNGTMNGQAGISDLSAIEVDGDKVSFNTSVNTPMGAIHLAFSGTVAGSAISGTCTTMFGDNRFSGTRA